jgi:hypothetical protein
MIRLKVFAAVMIGLAASACASTIQQSPEVAAIDRNCADTASTGDSYRYCVQLGLEQAGLAPPDSGVDTSVLALRAE